MTAPRQVLPGTTYLVTRRCAQRQFLLRPCQSTNEIFLYVLALAAQRYGVQIHAYCVLSNHFHLVITDPDARLPAFEQYLDGLVARAVNASLGRWESFWAPNSYSAVALVAPEDVLDKAAYVLANPVAAGLVRFGRLWPGLWSDPATIGRGGIVARRPAAFFDPKGLLPQAVELRLAAPPGFASMLAFRDGLTSALAAREAHHGARQPSFLGVLNVLRQKPAGRPKDVEPRRGLSPRIAAADRWRRIEVLGRLTEFARKYRTAWSARRRGAAGTRFPAGTYLLRVLHGVPCEAFG
jgi:REP element-mobilizing transposase RayT